MGAAGLATLDGTGAGLSGGAALYSSGFLPTLYSGVRLRTQGDPILDISSPAGVDEKLQRDTLDHKTTLRVNDGLKSDLVGLPETLRAVKGVDPTSSVILDVRGSVPWGDVIQTYDACRAAKFSAINFAAEPKELE